MFRRRVADLCVRRIGSWRFASAFTRRTGGVAVAVDTLTEAVADVVAADHDFTLAIASVAQSIILLHFHVAPMVVAVVTELDRGVDDFFSAVESLAFDLRTMRRSTNRLRFRLRRSVWIFVRVHSCCRFRLLTPGCWT